MTASAGHETRALLRAHLSAASPYRHRTHHCPVCRRLQRLVADGTAQATEEPTGAPHEAGEDEQSYSA